MISNCHSNLSVQEFARGNMFFRTKSGVFAQKASVFRRNCYRLVEERESSLSGDRAQDENDGHRPQTLSEGFYCFCF